MIRPKPVAAFYAAEMVSDFAFRAARAETLAALAHLLDAFARALGFRYHALLHHGDLARRAPRLVRIDNYPGDWVGSFVHARLFRDDPVQRTSLRTGMGFAWTDMTRFIALSRVQIAILENGIRAGLGAGYTVPLPMTGEPPASCSFVTRPGAPYPERALWAAQLGARIAYERALRLKVASLKARPARLTPRQRDCVALVAQSKTDWEIGVILGISEETVTKYVNAARRRYGVARRSQLPIMAYLDGEIDLGDIGLWQ